MALQILCVGIDDALKIGFWGNILCFWLLGQLFWGGSGELQLGSAQLELSEPQNHAVCGLCVPRGPCVAFPGFAPVRGRSVHPP